MELKNINYDTNYSFFCLLDFVLYIFKRQNHFPF